jgi:creatinine amidohydrolase
VKIELSDYRWPDVQDLASRGATVIVPVGAFEQHGHHLPLKVDAFLVSQVAQRAARAANERGVTVVVTPPVWTGYSPHHMDFPGTVTLDATVFMSVLISISSSLAHHGFEKILLLNGHGGNAHLLRTTVQRLRFEHDIDVVAASYWDFALTQIQEWRLSEVGGINHACEMETALMLALAPDTVRQELAEDLYLDRQRHLPADLTVGGPVTRAATFAELSKQGAIGAPSLATAERGQDLLARIVEAVVEFLVDYASWSPRTRGDR